MPTKRSSSSKTSLPPEKDIGSELTADLTGFTATTGRFLVLLREDGGKSAIKALREAAAISEGDVALSSDFKTESLDVSSLGGSEALIFEELGVAVLNVKPDTGASLQAAAADENQPDILAVEEERIVYGFASEAAAYLRGLRRGVDLAVEEALGFDEHGTETEAEEVSAQDVNFTWGLLATRVNTSRFSGQGIRLAVLDTGMDIGHPDFAGRNPITASFINGQSVQDGNGHGTHCIGTSCGSLNPPTGQPRYGIAHRAQILAGKVLSNAGSGADAGILAGIQWAIQARAQVISMSLGAPVSNPAQPFSQVFENAARRALAAGTLIIAAAGNESRRPGLISPVGHPANCPSIMAVGAVDSALRVASFSCGGFNPNGGKVDIAGPGVDILSSWPRPVLRRSISGTSMATPHVAGIAALIAESRPNMRGAALWQALVSNARPLAAQSRDVGAGLVQAPQ